MTQAKRTEMGVEMNADLQKPGSNDAVLGGDLEPLPLAGLVLGGMVGVKNRFKSAIATHRIAALREALQYGDRGLGILIAALEDDVVNVRLAARLLIAKRIENPDRVLAKYSNYQHFQCLHTLTGHAKSVLSLGITADCLMLASCGDGKTIKLWDSIEGAEITILSGHTNCVRSLCISPDGKKLISGGRDRTIRVWDITTGKEILSLSGHSGFVNSVTVTPDGQTIVSGSQDTTIKTWNLETGEDLRTLKGHTNLVDAVALSPDGKLVASCSWDTTIRV